jgi:Zn-dependent protease
MKIHISDDSGMSDILRDLKLIISRYFSVEDFRWSNQAAVFYIMVDEDRLEDNFNSLRKELISKGYVPTLVREHHDHLIYVTKKPALEPRSVVVNIIMFILTLISTIWAGAVLWVPRTKTEISSTDFGSQISDMFAVLGDPELIGYGALFFALPLMLILGIHELGHYFMSKKHGVDASLPFFIPIPPFIGPLGTFGAFISMREPMPSKKALIDIGAAGPIAGFIVAVPVTMIGLALTGWYPVEFEPSGEAIMSLGSPLLFTGLEALIPLEDDLLIHPTAFAGWVGLLVTSMNLLPAGQLDGGHIVRALFGEKSKYVSYFVVLVLIVLGFGFAGWWIFTFLILMLGTSHPPPLNDITKLTPERKAIGAFAVTMLVICFVPVPIMIDEFIQPEFEMEIIDDELIAGSGEIVNFTLVISNSGSEQDSYEIISEMIYLKNQSANSSGPFENVEFAEIPMNITEPDKWIIEIEPEMKDIKKRTTIRSHIFVKVPDNAELGDELAFSVTVSSETNPDKVEALKLKVRIGELSLRYHQNTKSVHAGNMAYFDVMVRNTGTAPMTVVLNSAIDERNSTSDILTAWTEPILSTPEELLAPSEYRIIEILISVPSEAKIDDYIIIILHAEDKINSSISDEAAFRIIVD